MLDRKFTLGYQRNKKMLLRGTQKESEIEKGGYQRYPSFMPWKSVDGKPHEYAENVPAEGL